MLPHRITTRHSLLLAMIAGVCLTAFVSLHAVAETKTFRAGAYAMDITPAEFPVIINGGMSQKTADKVVDPLHARCLVLDDGASQIAIVVVDSCMLPRELVDEVKRLASTATNIAPNRILISATHTHSAPAAMDALGSSRDHRYCHFMVPRIAQGIQRAHKNLRPAKIGWAVGRDEKNVGCRRWRMKPGVAPTNPFGGTTNDLAQTLPGFGNANAIEATGPVDPLVTILSLQTLNGRPLALLANYSLHYVGSPAISADYFAVFCDKMTKLVGGESADPPFMAALSNGTSGDTWLLDYTKKYPRKFDINSVASDVSQAAFEAYQRIEYQTWVPIVMEEHRLTRDVRLPSEEEVTRAKVVLEKLDGKLPTTLSEVYARETVKLSEMPPTRELKIQAIRLGGMGIVGIPAEVFASTGVTIKAETPLEPTMIICLANGNEGYVPPPEQHELGGYTTWRARTSCLEKQAEPTIRATVLELLEKVAVAQP
jgi:neutral ceramidase